MMVLIIDAGQAHLANQWSTLIDRVLRSAKHEEQTYNSCKGMLHMCNEVPRTPSGFGSSSDV